MSCTYLEDEDSDVDMEEHKRKLEHIYSVKGKHVRNFVCGNSVKN